MLECDNEQQWQQITLIRMSPPSSDIFRLILETASQVWNWTFTRHRFISNFDPILVNLETVKICLIWSYTSLMHFCKSTLEINVNPGPTQIHQIHNKLQNKLRLADNTSFMIKHNFFIDHHLVTISSSLRPGSFLKQEFLLQTGLSCSDLVICLFPKSC